MQKQNIFAHSLQLASKVTWLKEAIWLDKKNADRQTYTHTNSLPLLLDRLGQWLWCDKIFQSHPKCETKDRSYQKSKLEKRALNRITTEPQNMETGHTITTKYKEATSADTKNQSLRFCSSFQVNLILFSFLKRNFRNKIDIDSKSTRISSDPTAYRISFIRACFDTLIFSVWTISILLLCNLSKQKYKKPNFL